MPHTDNHRDYLPVLGRVPSGIYILTIAHQDDNDGVQETGMLASWVMQAGFEPPMLTVAVKKGRYVCDWLAGGDPFALNVVAENQKSLLAHFGRGFEPGEPAFEELTIERDSRGVALLAEGCLGYLLCEPREHIETGDHVIFTAELLGGRLFNEDAPMIHHRKSGAHY